MQKHEVINAMIESGYNLEKMDEFGTCTFGKTIGFGDREIRKIVEIDETDKGLHFYFYKTCKVSGADGDYQQFGSHIYCLLDELYDVASGVVTDIWFNQFVL